MYCRSGWMLTIMEEIYHYTKIRQGQTSIVESIIQKDALHFHSSFYRKYAKQDYQRIRNNSSDIVKNICEKNKWEYDPGDLVLNPYIISFCMDKDSNYMWEHYADNGCGMKLILDKNMLKSIEHGNPDGHSNYLDAIETSLTCLYVDIDKEDCLEDILLANMNQPELKTWGEFDKLKFLIVSIKDSKPYNEEKEYRHIHLHHIVSIAKYNNEDPYIENDNGPIDVNEMYIDILFPHEMLLGIEVGPHAKEEDLEYVRQHIIRMGFDPRKVHIKRNKSKL